MDSVYGHITNHPVSVLCSPIRKCSAPMALTISSWIVMWCVCSSDQVFYAFAYTQIRDQH